MIYQKVHKNMILRVLFSMLSFVLILILIMNAGIVQCFAFAGAAPLFYLLVAIMGACGITFATSDLADIAAQALYNNCPPVLQDWLQRKSMEISALGAVATGTVAVVINYWSDFIDAIVKTFGDYTGVDAVFDLSTDYTLSGVKSGNEIVVDSMICMYGNSVIAQVGNGCKITWYGGDSAALSSASDYIRNYVGNNIGYTGNAVTGAYVVDFTGGLSFITNYTSGSLDFVSTYPSFAFRRTWYDNRFYSFFVNASSLYSSHSGLQEKLFFNGEPVILTNVTGADGADNCTFTLSTATYPNIVEGGVIVGSDIPVPDSICPDGIWSSTHDFFDWLSSLGFGDDIPSVGALPGNPSIDTTAYPGNDTWHDGIDDVGTVPGSIGISIPGDISDVADYSPDIARDISNADTIISDTTIDDTQTGDKTDTDDNNKTGTKPGGLPALSLPEILFKKKFPFCLPWDLYSIFVILNAEPVAPKFDIPFKFDRLGIDYTFSIDLSDYDDLAKILRVSLSIMFVIALILLSRRLIGAE